MPRPIALFDIDNTMYDGFSYFDLLEKHVTEKHIEQNVLDNALEQMQKYQANLQDYETMVVELLDIYASGLNGVEYEVILRSTQDFYKGSDNFFDYVVPTINHLRQTHDVALVTAEPQFIAEAVGNTFGVEKYYSSEYEMLDGRFTGQVKHYLAARHEKHDAIKHLIHEHGNGESFAFGDSEGDLEMLRSVNYPICINPTSGLRLIAEKEGWHLPRVEEVQGLVVRLFS